MIEENKTLIDLSKKIVELEKRIQVLENTRPIVYPQYQPAAPYPNWPTFPNGSQYPYNNPAWC